MGSIRYKWGFRGLVGSEARQGGVCQDVSHRESLNVPETDKKPELPHPWSLFWECECCLAELASVLLCARSHWGFPQSAVSSCGMYLSVCTCHKTLVLNVHSWDGSWWELCLDHLQCHLMLTLLHNPTYVCWSPHSLRSWPWSTGPWDPWSPQEQIWAWVLLQGRPTTGVRDSWDEWQSQTPDKLVPDAITLVACMTVSSFYFHFVQVAKAPLDPWQRYRCSETLVKNRDTLGRYATEIFPALGKISNFYSEEDLGSK